MGPMQRLRFNDSTMAPGRLESSRDVARMADSLRAPGRHQPTVLISTRYRQPAPLIGAERVAGSLAGVADVFVIETGELTDHLRDLLGEGRGVSGGASRVYPPGGDWFDRPYDAALVLTYEGEDSTRSERRVVTLALSCASGAYSTSTPRGEDRRPQPGPDAPTRAPRKLGLEEAAVLREVNGVRPTPVLIARATGAQDEYFVESVKRRAEEMPEARTPELAPEPPPRDSTGTAGAPTSLDPRSTRSVIASLTTSLELARVDAQRLAQEATRAEAALAGERRRLAAAIEEATQDLRVKLATERQKTEAANERARTAGSAARKSGARSAVQAEPQAALSYSLFPTAEEAARHAIYLAWVERVPATEKADHPLPEYAVGRAFTASLDTLTAGQLARALRCVVDILTGMGETMHARRIHPLRMAMAGNSGVHTDERGAVCMRANIESETASARRLHYWKLPDNSIELIRIVTHEDVDP